jgi:hypothetical protein
MDEVRIYLLTPRYSHKLLYSLFKILYSARSWSSWQGHRRAVEGEQRGPPRSRRGVWDTHWRLVDDREPVLGPAGAPPPAAGPRSSARSSCRSAPAAAAFVTRPPEDPQQPRIPHPGAAVRGPRGRTPRPRSRPRWPRRRRRVETQRIFVALAQRLLLAFLADCLDCCVTFVTTCFRLRLFLFTFLPKLERDKTLLEDDYVSILKKAITLNFDTISSGLPREHRVKNLISLLKKKKRKRRKSYV